MQAVKQKKARFLADTKYCNEAKAGAAGFHYQIVN